MSMNKTAMAFYEPIAMGDVGPPIVELPMIDHPAGPRGKKRYRFDDDEYVSEMREPVKRFEQNFL
jgi:hypothetical protein